MTLFAVMRTRGAAWEPDKPMRAQRQWSEHASFMEHLAADGFVVLGGPLGDGEDVLLAISATDEREVRFVLQQDPWSKSEILALRSVQPWKILLEGPRK